MLGTRRTFLQAAVGGLVAGPGAALARVAEGKPLTLTREVGITTGSFMRHMTVERQPGKLCLLDLPKIMRDELDMKVIDLMTATLASFEPKYLDQLRAADPHFSAEAELTLFRPPMETAVDAPIQSPRRRPGSTS